MTVTEVENWKSLLDDERQLQDQIKSNQDERDEHLSQAEKCLALVTSDKAKLETTKTEKEKIEKQWRKIILNLYCYKNIIVW